jgi:YidC/Oxa1 family membrane protein insertase
MDNIRLFLVIALVFISLLLYQAWQIDYGKKPSTTTDTTVTSEVSTPSTTTIAELPSTISGEPPLAESSSRINAEFPESQPQRVLNSANRIQVETDLFRLEIDTQGGDIRRVDLLAYPNHFV